MSIKKNTILIVLIGALVIAIIFLGGRLFVTKQSQPTQAPVVKQQQQNDNSQQGGPDVPGQAGVSEGAGTGGNN